MDIIYRDEQLIAVNKPAGLLVHRSSVDRHATEFALQMVRDMVGHHVFPVHRLDRPTSGVLLFACSPPVAALLTASFTAGQVNKCYLAVVRGIPAIEVVVDHPLAEEQDRMTDRLARKDKAPQEAVTAFRRLAHAEVPIPSGSFATSRYGLVEARPRTGRKHQIRRHGKHLSHPVIGDTTWGDGRHNRLFREQFDCSRLLLHAVELELIHPASGGRLLITAPLDGEFAAIIDRLDWRERVPAAWLPGGGNHAGDGDIRRG